jgi:hypothetical protein
VAAASFRRAVAALTLLAGAASVQPAAAERVVVYSGACDASAAVPLGPDHFVVGDDQHNTLHVYRRGQAQAVASLDLGAFLGTAPAEDSDIEAAAMVGTRIYWIGSHGRDRRGRFRPTRHRLFATDVLRGDPPILRATGAPYVDLLRDLAAAPALGAYALDAAARLPAKADGGFNIEGLAATPDGRLLIGLRNPLPHGRALVIPLENPAEVIQGRAARFGTPAELDLGQRGIRSIDLVGSGYLIVAGPPGAKGRFAIYRWSGKAGDAARQMPGIDLQHLHPEALVALAGSDRVQLFSDDGEVKVGNIACKKLPLAQQSFRSLIVSVPP